MVPVSMSCGVDGGVFVVSGGARGLGASLVKALLKARASVHVVDHLDRDDPAWQALFASTPAEGSLEVWNEDVSQHETWIRLAEHLKTSGRPLQGLVNNAGITGPRRTVTQTDLADWNRVLAVNLTAAMLAIRELAVCMEPGGSIVNIGSTVGMTGYYSAAYSCSKWALRGLTRSAALELASRGIRANCVCPGVVDTDMIRNSPALVSALQHVIPLHGMAQAEQIAQTVMFLLGPHSSYITATDIAVDGGVTGGGIFWPVGRSVGALAGADPDSRVHATS
jgi:NAD(P)-dependent dehydrogenase (short-subunit alcohol dehydrogenase family)